MSNDDIDEQQAEALRRRAAGFLDAETDAIDLRTRVALGDARGRALAARRAPLLWGGAGIALAAGLAVFVVLPRGSVAPAIDPDSLAAAELALSGDADIAIDEDLAFIAWLEENDGST